MPSQILVPLDGSEQAEIILPLAAALARGTHSSLTLMVNTPFVVYYWPFSTELYTYSSWQDEKEASNHDYLAQVAQYLLTKEGVMVHIEFLTGNPVTNIVSYAAHHSNVRLIAITIQKQSKMRHLFFGNVTDKLIHSTATPLLLVRYQQRKEPLRSKVVVSTIIVPLDGSTFAEQVVEQVQSIATALEANVIFVSVLLTSSKVLSLDPTTVSHRAPVELQEETQRRKRYLKQQALRLEQAGVRVQTRVITGRRAADEILRVSSQEQADLIVMAMRKRRGFQRICPRGTAMKLIQSGHLPVMLV